MSISTNIMGGEHAYQFIIGNTKLPLFYMPFENPNVMRLTDKKEFDRTQTIGGQVFEHWGEQPQVMHVSMRIRKNSSAGNIIGIYNEKKYDLEDPMVCTELEMMKLMYHMDRRKLKWSAGDIINKKFGGGDTKESATSILSVATGGLGSIASTSVSKGGIIDASAYFNLTDTTGVASGKSITNGTKIGNWLNKISDTVIIYKFNIYSGFFMNFEVTEDGEQPFFNVVTFDFLVTRKLSDSIYSAMADTSVGRTAIAAVGAATTVSALGYTIDSITTGAQSLIDGLF